MPPSTTSTLSNVTLFTDFNISTTDEFEPFKQNSIVTGMGVAIGYGIAHGILVLMLATRLFYESRKDQNQKLSIRHFFLDLWKERGIYTPLLIHIYDTATDLGVLYEWRQLADYENRVRNLESLDMEQFFTTALGFMLAYRGLLGLVGGMGALYVFAESWNLIEKLLGKCFDKFCDNCCCSAFGKCLEVICCCDAIGKCLDWYENLADKCICGRCLYLPLMLLYFVGFAIILSIGLTVISIVFACGFVFGALELMIFLGIYYDFQQKKGDSDAKRGAGMGQKVCQSTEGILESLPEVIMQSVFIMRSRNDAILREVAGSIGVLVFFSIAASLLSITSKYIWIDEVAVIESATGLMPKKDDWGDDPEPELLLGKCLCSNSYYISYGYVIRMIWRLSAVSARFVIFALIWVVLGGAFEVIMIPTMMVLWYIALFTYAFGGHCAVVTSQMKKSWKEVMRSEDLPVNDEYKQYICGINWFIDCGVIVLVCLGVGLVLSGVLFVLFLIGVVSQLGIAVITGKAIYFMRTVENCFLMVLISIFALIKFDCTRCADAEQRHVLNNNNDYILAWLVAGWVAVLTHLAMTIKMNKVINPEYDMNVQTVVDAIKKDLDERYQEYLELQERIARTRRVRYLMRHYRKEEIASRIDDETIPSCETCTDAGNTCKLVPSVVDLAPGSYGNGLSCTKCKSFVDPTDPIDVIWHCMTTNCKYRLCTECGHIEDQSIKKSGTILGQMAAKKAKQKKQKETMIEMGRTEEVTL
eukprot:129952_1